MRVIELGEQSVTDAIGFEASCDLIGSSPAPLRTAISTSQPPPLRRKAGVYGKSQFVARDHEALAMSESEPTCRSIQVPILTRVEGEGALHVRLRGRQIEDVQLRIYEPPRFFEALLRGKPMDDVADITSRICGICPIAY